MFTFRRAVGRTVFLAVGSSFLIQRNISKCDYIVTKDSQIKSTKDHQNAFNQFADKSSFDVFDASVTHRAIFKILHARSSSLSANSFYGRDGSACSLLQGPKGIGKSEMLVGFKKYCKKEFPNIIPVYIT